MYLIIKNQYYFFVVFVVVDFVSRKDFEITDSKGCFF